MGRSQFFVCFTAFFLLNYTLFFDQVLAQTSPSFNQTYQVTWGSDHVSFPEQGAQVQLSLDNYSGSGFASKLSYGSGFFNMSIKLPDNVYTAGLVIAFYLTSPYISVGDRHDELDFEFLGHTQGKPYVFQTNVFASGQGNREQRMSLWFDPSADFHSYQILWNEHQIVFYIDDIPIRVFKNNTNIGVPYPTKPMQLTASLWNGEDWATDQGRSKMNYTYAPFKAQYKGFGINGCPAQNNNSTQNCFSSSYWWNGNKYWQLSSSEQSAYDNVKTKYVYYDYCKDVARFPRGMPPECL